MELKANDLVIARDIEGANGVLRKNAVYRIECVTHRGKFVRIDGVPYELAAARFEKFPVEEEQTITLPIAGNQ
jgi:hypothetical protein